jgi:hypothetical protein
MKNKESNCHSNKCNIWSLAPKGTRHQDYWPTDRRRKVTTTSTTYVKTSKALLKMVYMVLVLFAEEGDYAMRATRLSSTQATQFCDRAEQTYIEQTISSRHY